MANLLYDRSLRRSNHATDEFQRHFIPMYQIKPHSKKNYQSLLERDESLGREWVSRKIKK
jgi:hypothetical protein